MIWKLYPLRHFTDQTIEAAISKFDLGVLYSTRMKMGIIKSVLIKEFILKKYKKLKKKFFSLSALYFKDLFRFNPLQTDFDTFLRQFHMGKFN